MSYFRIFTKGWKLQNKTISAVLDLFIEDKILLLDEEFSLNLSVPNLLETAFYDHLVESGNPLFICNCESIFCESFNFEVKHINHRVIIGKFNKLPGETKHNLSFEIPRDVYIREIKKISQEYIEFCTILEDIDFWVGEKEKIKEKIRLLGTTGSPLPEETGDISVLLKMHSTQAAANFIKNFNWKIEEVLSLLNSPDEVIRYKCVELLTVLSYFESVPYLILKIPEETEEIKYAIYKHLSRGGMLKNAELLDEIYIRRFFRKTCRKQFLHLKKQNSYFPMAFLVQNNDERISLSALSSLEKVGKIKDKRIIYTLMRIIADKGKDVKIRKKAVGTIKSTEDKFTSQVVEIIQDKTEDVDFRAWCIREISDIGGLDYLTSMRQIFGDKNEPLLLRNLCQQYLTKAEFYRKIKPSYILFFVIILILGVVNFLPFPLFIKILSVIISILVIIGFIFYELS